MKDVAKPFKKIIVAYDNSPAARDALSVGIELCSVLETSLEIVTVIEPPPAYAALVSVVNPDVARGIDMEWRQHCQELVDSAVSEGQRRGVKVVGSLVEADEVEGIVSFIRQKRADLLIIGSKQHSTHIARLWSTVSGLEQNAPCSVLAVHPPWNPGPTGNAEQSLTYASA